MIPAPNLDDRTHADIVEEALRLIPQYCPEWTNHNAADPGITLIELFAWMTEMVVYRLNKVTDKNFLAFLDLMGVSSHADRVDLLHQTIEVDLGPRIGQHTDALPVSPALGIDQRGRIAIKSRGEPRHHSDLHRVFFILDAVCQ